MWNRCGTDVFVYFLFRFLFCFLAADGVEVLLTQGKETKTRLMWHGFVDWPSCSAVFPPVRCKKWQCLYLTNCRLMCLFLSFNLFFNAAVSVHNLATTTNAVLAGRWIIFWWRRRARGKQGALGNRRVTLYCSRSFVFALVAFFFCALEFGCMHACMHACMPTWHTPMVSLIRHVRT